jgi:hypothetical protein
MDSAAVQSTNLVSAAGQGNRSLNIPKVWKLSVHRES